MEKNKDNLKKALDGLPSYAPSARHWDSIEQKLNEATSTKVLTTGLAALPEYSPADTVWLNIDKTLEADRSKASRLRTLRYRNWAAAAAVLLLIAVFFQINQSNATSKEKIEYAQEVVEDILLERPWDESEKDAYAEILAMCELQSFACTRPVFQSLKTELEELTLARNAIREAIGTYGTEAELLIELKEIEMLRTDIIKQLAEQVA